MDFSVKHWAPFPRRFPSSFPLVTTSFIDRKNHWVRRAFDTCNFSLILRGSGEFHREGRVWEVKAPCVITQWPGEFVEYGPPLPATWDELYLIFPAEARDAFARCSLIDPDLPVWPITDLASVRHSLEELARVANSPAPETKADRMDRVCERLVLETRLGVGVGPAANDAMQSVAAGFRQDLATKVSWEAIAKGQGLSRSTFRRRWNDAFAEPPARTLQRIRLQEACRLLAETDHPIRAIAQSVGIDDELYFSRCFHRAFQLAPRDYRKTYRLRERRD